MSAKANMNEYEDVTHLLSIFLRTSMVKLAIPAKIRNKTAVAASTEPVSPAAAMLYEPEALKPQYP